jgi:Helix-turn-helix domain
MERVGDTSWMTIEEAAVRQGCSVATIWRRAREGKLHLRRLLGRTVVDLAELEGLQTPERRQPVAR